MILWLMLVGCTDSTNATGTPFGVSGLDRFTVDCLGMIRDAEGPFGEAARSRTWAYNETTQSRESRCFVQWPDNATGATSLDAMRGNQLAGAVTADAPFVNMSVVWGGALYNSYDGSFTFDSFEDGKASGTYRVKALTLGVAEYPVVDEDAIIEGRFDWCDVQRTDCPHKSAIEGLDKSFSVSAPAAEGEGQTVYCRILHDTSSRAVQVDMQFATWNGINTSELFVDACYPAGGTEPQGNTFTLRVGDVDGPGTYEMAAPRTLWNSDGSQQSVPGFEWRHPAVLETDIPSYQVCTSYLRQAFVFRSDAGGDQCVVTLDNDRFALDCGNARHGGLGQFGQDVEEGPFHFESDCDWTTL